MGANIERLCKCGKPAAWPFVVCVECSQRLTEESKRKLTEKQRQRNSRPAAWMGWGAGWLLVLAIVAFAVGGLIYALVTEEPSRHGVDRDVLLWTLLTFAVIGAIGAYECSTGTTERFMSSYILGFAIASLLIAALVQFEILSPAYQLRMMVASFPVFAISLVASAYTIDPFLRMCRCIEDICRWTWKRIAHRANSSNHTRSQS